jgi:hypothetical protein
MQKEIERHTYLAHCPTLLQLPTLGFVGLRCGCVGLSCVSRRWPGLAVLVVEMSVVLAVTWKDVVVARYIYKQSLMSKKYAERNKKTYLGSRRDTSRAPHLVVRGDVV